jgi:tRNA 2-thiouridine synthesizing protein E
MPTLAVAGKEFEVDEDGFLIDMSLWSKEVAEGLAKSEGIDALTEEHWKVINFLRTYFDKYKVAPPVRMLSKETGFQMKYIYQLFPTGPAKGACKLAGLAKPTGCV